MIDMTSTTTLENESLIRHEHHAWPGKKYAIIKEFDSAKQLRAWIKAVTKKGEELYKIVSVDSNSNSVEAIRLSSSHPEGIALAKKQEQEMESMMKKYDGTEESEHYWRTRT
jgi:hypothetical protein